MTTEEQQPRSYIDQLLDCFTEQSYESDDIRSIIRNFSKEQYEKRHAMSDKIPFGKYKYKSIEDICRFDQQYLKWLYRQDILNSFPDLKANISKYI